MTPVTAQALKDITGYKDHTITDSIRILEDPTRQLVHRMYKGWRLSSAFQLPLGTDGTEVIRDIREKVLSSSSGLIDIDLKQNPLPPPEENRDIREKLPNYESAHEAALKAGIRDPMAEKIADLPFVTPELIAGHVAQTQVEHKHLGAAIYRIMHQWPVNPRYLPDHNDNEDGRRYVEGQFAEFIEH